MHIFRQTVPTTASFFIKVQIFCSLGDKQTLGDTGVPSGYVIQCIINIVEFDVIQAWVRAQRSAVSTTLSHIPHREIVIQDILGSVLKGSGKTKFIAL